MKRVLVVHPQFEIIGGAELVALRIMEQLVLNYNLDICLLTLKPGSIHELAESAGINLPPSSVTIQVASCPKWLLRAESKFHLLKLAYLNRHAKKIAAMFDICIGTYNEIDFGRSGFQYIHHPNFANRKLLHSYRMISSKNILDVIPFLNVLYKKLIFLISGDTIEGYRRNITAVNSVFIKNVVKDLYGIDGRVIYPGFVSERQSKSVINWDDRELRFVTIGRISPDKDLLATVDHFKYLSIMLPDAKFVIVGRIGDESYYQAVINKTDSLNIEVEILTDINNSQLRNLLETSKFYIGSKQYEHFGISVLEAAQAGCLTFVHNSGGQREIVTLDILRFETSEDLREKISLLLSDNSLRNDTLRILKESIMVFSDNVFNRQVDAILQPLINA